MKGCVKYVSLRNATFFSTIKAFLCHRPVRSGLPHTPPLHKNQKDLVSPLKKTKKKKQPKHPTPFFIFFSHCTTLQRGCQQSQQWIGEHRKMTFKLFFFFFNFPKPTLRPAGAHLHINWLASQGGRTRTGLWSMRVAVTPMRQLKWSRRPTPFTRMEKWRAGRGSENRLSYTLSMSPTVAPRS